MGIILGRLLMGELSVRTVDQVRSRVSSIPPLSNLEKASTTYERCDVVTHDVLLHSIGTETGLTSGTLPTRHCFGMICISIDGVDVSKHAHALIDIVQEQFAK